MPVADWIALIFLAGIGGAQVVLRSSLVRHLKLAMRVSVLLIIFWSLLMAGMQYVLFQGDPLGKFLLPPHQSSLYFWGYVGTRFLLPPAIALLAAITGGYAAYALNRLFGERFLKPEEPILFALGIFLTGYPGFFFYIPLVLFFGVLLAARYRLLAKGRAPFYFIWLPAAFFVILIKNFLISPDVLSSFNL